MEDSTVIDPSENGRLREGREGLEESPLEGLHAVSKRIARDSIHGVLCRARPAEAGLNSLEALHLDRPRHSRWRNVQSEA